ncbi:hypothetical protein Q1695_010939 [Nippostrongylus brasiliensis]|nr:hypothetical protein Q1695_010939 [Nippostrongylus brasiliensis]
MQWLTVGASMCFARGTNVVLRSRVFQLLGTSGASSTVIRPCSGSSVKNFSSTATRKRPSEVAPTCGNLPKRLKNCDPTKWEAAPVVYTDGACSNNGKLGAKAGYGVYWGPDHEDNACGPVTGAPTNNRGELLAVDVALKQAIQKGLSYIVIRTDSKLLIESMDSWMQKWKRNNWKTSIGKDVLNQDLLRSIDESTQSIHVKFEHVPGHSGVPGNEAADSLARQGAQMFSSGSNQ